MRRRGYPVASGRHGDNMRALEMSKSIVDAKYERGATTRGCSGGRGSDDTRGYGVGSGDVGKELPRGWSRKSVSLSGGPARSIPRNWFIGCQSSEIP